MWPELTLIVYGLSLLVLSTFGLNRYVLVTLFRKHLRHESREPLADADARPVTIQLPIYNEYYVAERLIRSACELDYPRHLLEIQVLDDSTDETLELTRRLVRDYRKRGFEIVHLHRRRRIGFKGGALDHGLKRARGEFIAIFDADFVIPRDFLRRTLPHFDGDDVGMVQTRWSYLNDEFSMLTRAAALGLDGHFVVEQSARHWGGLFMNFNGTAGVWRARCIREAGGWQHDTLTEDLDLSYRAQLAGWRFKYLLDVTSDSEIPADIHSMKAQQFRWTKGSMETARKILPRMWRADLPLWVKTHGTLHLLGNIVFPFFLAVGVLNLPIVLVAHHYGVRLLWPVSAYFLFTLFGTFSYYWTAQRAVRIDWRRRAVYFPLFMAASIGLAVYNTQAAVEGLLGRKSPFLRTPKYSLTSKGQGWRRGRYRSPATWSTAAELVLGLYTLAAIAIAVHLGEYGALPFLCLFAYGYLMVAVYSLKHLSHARNEVLVIPSGHEPQIGGVLAAGPELALDGAAVGEPSQNGTRRARRRAGRKRATPTVTLLGALVLLQGCRAGDGEGAPPEGASRAGATAAGPAALAFPPEPPPGFHEVALVQKDRAHRIVTRALGGAEGRFWFRPSGELFEWFVKAQGLPGGRAYRLLLNVDGTTYAIASLEADGRGELKGYGALEEFAERICDASEELDPPTPLAGVHKIRVWILDDGARAGSARRAVPTAQGGPDLPCSGNGDGSFEPRLVERSLVQFRGG